MRGEYMQRTTNYLFNSFINKVISSIPYRFGEARELIALSLGRIKYLTSEKIANILIREYERLRRVHTPRGFPFHALIDVINTCNLQCPYCPTGRRRNSGRSDKIIDIELIHTFLSHYGKYLVEVGLFNWGEPLMHPRIADIVRIFHEKRIFTQMSSNLNIRNKKVLESICDAGLDNLIISISGITQEIYQLYHRKGNVRLVLDNLRYIVNYKKQMKYNNPVIELKYLVFENNCHQIADALDLAKDIGVDIFRAHYAGGAQEEIIQINGEKRKLLYPSTGMSCLQLWRTVVLNSDGGIAPCCFLYFKEDDFADMRDIRNATPNQRYTQARMMFDKSAAGDLAPELQHPCLKCTFVHRQQHLKEYLATNPHAKQGHRSGGP
jgi:MoaA/NifB/PqqE/SkfB family radical SAM enzyme